MTLQTQSEITAEIASVVRSLTAKQQIRHLDIAAALGLTKMPMSRRMNGLTSFTAEDMLILSRLFGVPLDALYGDAVTAPQSSAPEADSTGHTHAGAVPRPPVSSGAEDVPPTSSALPTLERIAS